ncbi:MAG TPA: hypothetical protein VNH46_12680 [Gemmatimonadales bacterium]|nr:hypothetical protein [Gemmatimonadales bacterium]
MALVLLAGGNLESLESALSASSEACRLHAVRILVVWPGPSTALAPVGRSFPEVDLFPVSPELSPQERRAEGAQRADAEILLIAEDVEAACTNWGDVLPARAGLLRDTGEARPVVDWPALLSAMGVGEPSGL